MPASIKKAVNAIRYGTLTHRRKWFVGIVIVACAFVVVLWVLFVKLASPFSQSQTAQPEHNRIQEFLSVIRGTFSSAGQQTQDLLSQGASVVDKIQSGIVTGERQVQQ